MKTGKFTPELRERAVRMVLEHRADHLVQIGPSRVDLPEFLMFGFTGCPLSGRMAISRPS
jgi:hypothetical protein